MTLTAEQVKEQLTWLAEAGFEVTVRRLSITHTVKLAPLAKAALRGLQDAQSAIEPHLTEHTLRNMLFSAGLVDASAINDPEGFDNGKTLASIAKLYEAIVTPRAEEGRIGFMDGVDWQHELGDACGGNRVYPSVEDLKENSKCWEQCGIVEVEVRLVRWVEDQNFDIDDDSPDMNNGESNG